MFSASVVSLHGIKIDALEKVSVIVRIVSYELEFGNFTMKSIATDVKGRVKFSDVMGKGGGFSLLGLFFLD